MDRLWIPGPLPGLNEIINAKGGRWRSGYDGYASLKKRWTASIILLARAQNFPELASGHFVYLWREPTKRRDPSNVVAGGRKLVEDALQSAGLLAGDGWKNVLSFQDHWLVDKQRPGVTVFVTQTKAYAEQDYWIEEDENATSKRADRV